ncbi:hypothetical protein AVEN_6976-1 [Araneus ventricosus]|uniref:Uncharacterized protein n=1 Tax=Araneus ventricosus TaxID=182803 RepID=A0A4Y2L519_ARAVE|nr:hypothetical protein AVEN_6976-1 [Araneus ventricosus]
MTSSSQAWTPDLGDKFGDEMWYLKNAGIFSISLLGPISGFIQMIPCDVTACRGEYKRTVLRSQRLDHRMSAEFEVYLWRLVHFASWSAVRR